MNLMLVNVGQFNRTEASQNLLLPFTESAEFIPAVDIISISVSVDIFVSKLCALILFYIKNVHLSTYAFVLINVCTVSDVVIPTNSPDRASIVLKAGQRVMVLKSPKGIYMQLENGKIIAIRTAFKVGGAGKGSGAQHQECKPASEKAEINAPEYKKGVLMFLRLNVTCKGNQQTDNMKLKECSTRVSMFMISWDL
jgi:hypothetical protein